MTLPHSHPEAFWNNLLAKLEEFVAMQHSNPSFSVSDRAVRFLVNTVQN